MKTIKIKIDGMTCNGCVNSIHSHFLRDESIENCSISLEKGEATIQTSLNPSDLIQQIEDLGFEAAEIT